MNGAGKIRHLHGASELNDTSEGAEKEEKAVENFLKNLRKNASQL